MNKPAIDRKGVSVARFVDTLTKQVGRRNALKAPALSEALGLPYGVGSNGDGRVLRLLANEATQEGHCICTDNSGYFVPETREEAEECLFRLTAQAANMRGRAERLRQSIDRQFATNRVT